MSALDDARDLTDAALGKLERRISREYARAAKDMREKQRKALAEFAKEREQREKALDNTESAMKAHERWLSDQAATNKWLSDMVEELSASAHNANVKASDMVNGALPRIYTENANRAAFSVDSAIKHDTGFTLVNEEAVRYLMMGGSNSAVGGDIIPEVTIPEELRKGIVDARRPQPDPRVDMRWNRQKFRSAITQGILQGESIPNIVKRTESIYGMNERAAVRAARTACTNVENAGRMGSFERAQRLGIDMELEWLATLDGRTRESHRALDGERVNIGERFSNGLRWPGDPTGPGAEVWNCRCRANGEVVGFDGERGDWADERGQRWKRLPDGMTYEEWKKAKPVNREESYKNKWGRVTPDWYRAASSLSAGRIDPTAQVWQGAGSQAIAHAQQLMDAAPQAAQDTWTAYEQDLRLHDGDSKRGAYYSPARHGVYMNVGKDLVNECGPMSTWFHEFGHMVDNLAAERTGEPLRIMNISHARGLHTAIQAEIDANVKDRWAALKAEVKTDGFRQWHERIMKSDAISAEDIERAHRMGFIDWYERKTDLERLEKGQGVSLAGSIPDIKKASAKEYVYKQISNELHEMPDAAQHAISDMYEAATKGKARGKWGHGKSYWDKAGRHQATEAFAEYYSAMMVKSETPITMATLRKWLPETTRKFEEILEEVPGL